MIIEFLASVLLWLMFLGAFILWVVDGVKKREAAIHALGASLVSWLFALMIKTVFPEPRPFVIDGQKALTFFTPRDGSFPSEHATIAFALAFTIFLHNRKIGFIFLVLAVLVGVGRVLANVHYPIDILGGAILGTMTAYMAAKIHLRG
jgi:undecaprenyl-diphosphatase